MIRGYLLNKLIFEKKVLPTKKYINHIEWLQKGHDEGKFGYVDFVIRLFNHAIEYVMKEDYSSRLKEFYRETKTLDKLRGESFKDVYPEYKDLEEYIK